MSRLNDIIRQVAKVDPQLAKDLQRETDALADRRAFGLNFERHVPEAVELPGRAVRKNDKVRILPERGEMPTKENERLYMVTGLVQEGGVSWANLVAMDDPADEFAITVDGLVVVAEFRDPIYPGLISTGRVERGGDKPYHAVINAENYHALQALLFTHRGKVDAIYIDPPYNTGARDWKYNNDYVESDDHYRHSKWLAMMERRLLLAKELLNPEDSVLIVTIDEKEYLRLGLLLEQTFVGSRIQMITALTNPKGVARGQEFYRVDEYVYFVYVGAARVVKGDDPMILTGNRLTEPPVAETGKRQVRWGNLLRSGTDARRVDRQHQFYPVFLNAVTGAFYSVGEPLLPVTRSRETVKAPEGTVAVWPLRRDGSEGRWQVGATRLRELIQLGYVSIGRLSDTGRASISYVTENLQALIAAGDITATWDSQRGVVSLEYSDDAGAHENPKTMWNRVGHSASEYGSSLLRELLPGRSFPFPKSLYAVEDSLRFFVAQKPAALVLDFFAGSGTTAHAVMRLNRQDGGTRTSILVTNNEVSADERRALREKGFRPGDEEWDQWGICHHITKPRIEAAISGRTPGGQPIRGNYKFVDEFPMSDGLQENVEFFTLTYESAMRVTSNREFARLAPLLWLRAGSRGPRIDDIPDGWGVAAAYGVIADLDQSEEFVTAVEAEAGLTHAFVITDEDRLFEALVRRLPDGVEPVRLYASYLRNFEIEAGRASG